MQIKKEFWQSVRVAAVALVITLGVNAAVAGTWAPATGVPPVGNADAPITLGATGQIKSGGLTLNTSGATYGLLVPNGNVGIGTSTPGQKLVVAGQAQITGGSPGAGKVLTSNATGVGKWSSFYTRVARRVKGASNGFSFQHAYASNGSGDGTIDVTCDAGDIAIAGTMTVDPQDVNMATAPNAVAISCSDPDAVFGPLGCSTIYGNSENQVGYGDGNIFTDRTSARNGWRCQYNGTQTYNVDCQVVCFDAQ